MCYIYIIYILVPLKKKPKQNKTNQTNKQKESRTISERVGFSLLGISNAMHHKFSPCFFSIIIHVYEIFPSVLFQQIVMMSSDCFTKTSPAMVVICNYCMCIYEKREREQRENYTVLQFICIHFQGS